MPGLILAFRTLGRRLFFRTAGRFGRLRLIARLGANFARTLLFALRAAFIGRRLRTGRARPGLLGLLPAALLTAARTIARRFALGFGLLGRDAGRLALLGFVFLALALLTGLACPGLIRALRLQAGFGLLRSLPGPGRLRLIA